jgi:beta-galactosidase
MKLRIILSALAILSLSTGISAQHSVNKPVLFDFGWRFHRGGALGAEKADFDDSQWRKIDLPHDWGIEDLPGTDSPFDRDAISQVNGGFTTGGTGWYRKVFSMPDSAEGKRIIIQFDGVWQNAEVWLNNRNVGIHPYGYTAFWFDISDKIVFGTDNVIAVKVRNEGENSRWYTGSGIYRHVWLEISNPVHIAKWGTYITTPEVASSQARVNIRTKIENLSGTTADVTIVTRILSPAGVEVSRSESKLNIENSKTDEVIQDLLVKTPELWSVETPSIYSAITEVYKNSLLKDSRETKFGIRSITFDVTNGFRLNGQILKLKGGCLHHDNGPLGSKAYDRAEERRIELLKASGFNAVRTSHNPPSAAFLDACDRLGMLVMDETFDMWRDQKNADDYNLYFDAWWQKDVESMIYRDRNHPSVIMWSIGNEIPNRQKPEVVATAKMLAGFIHSIEPTRPVTSAVNDLKPEQDPYFAALDIAGYNYAAGGDHGESSLYAFDNARVPQRIMAGTESYPLEAFSSWMEVIDHPFVIGDFVWTAFDYIGEASIGWRGYWQEQNFFPWNLAFCGDLDICGWKRPQSYYRDALWKENQISVFVTPPRPSFDLNPNRQSWSKWHWFDAVASWNWNGNEGKLLEVNVYSSCELAELFLNGKSLGKKAVNRTTKFMASWLVPYMPGKLEAIGYKGKKILNTSELNTSGDVSNIRLSADRITLKSNNQDLSYVTVELTDKNGILNPVAENLISFKLDGPGTIVGVGNANPVSIESFQKNERKAWRGKCMVIIKSGKEKGDLVLRAKSGSLSSSELKIRIAD